MTLRPGTRLGPYEITSAIGAGGMGEVFRARDTKLGRDVAVKVLPAAFATDAERVSRFNREAQILAALHHPNIASIYGLEDGAGALALAMEYVEGEDLAQRLARGALPLDDVLAIALQVAEALEEAHEKGIVHRDLKPANIKVRPDGRVKVLDFGLAKALGGTTSASGPDLSESPTLAHTGTAAGIILGTAPYMSPEQARAKDVDKRSDIWAFGVVVFEMLTGRRLFEGETVSDVLASVLKTDIDWSQLPASTPPGLSQVLRRCLERNPRNRLRDIGDARLVLAETIAAPGPARDTTGPPSKARMPGLSWVVALAALAVAAWAWSRRPQGAAADGNAHGVLTHLELSLPAGVDLVTRVAAGLAVSTDGRAIGMIGFREGQRRLYVHRLDRPEAIEVKGSSGVNALAFSPDGASIAFVPGGSRVMRVSLADQQGTVLATCADLRNSVSWSATGWISYLCAGEIWRVPAAGGAPAQLTHLDPARHEVLHTDAVELPGGRHLLFANLTDDAETSRIEALSLADGARKVVVEHATTPVVSPTGHLLFERDGAVWAMAFDPASATVSGVPSPVLPTAALAAPLYGSLAYRLSPTGTLVYMPREFDDKRVVAVARDGSERALDLPPGAYVLPRVSPDGRRLLLETARMLQAVDLQRGTVAPIANGTFGASFPAWSSDSRRIVFRRQTTPVWVAADGSGSGGPVPGVTLNDYPAAPGPDPDTLLVGTIRRETAGDIVVVPITGNAPTRTLLDSPAYEGGAQLSPDGHWLLYQSNASGEPEVYVRAYPALDRAWQVSEGGGAQTRWSPDGREIYYRAGGRIMSASFDGHAAEPRLGRPVALFADEFDYGPGITTPNYDVLPDGRFVFLRRTPRSGHLRVVLNWLPELERLTAPGGAR